MPELPSWAITTIVDCEDDERQCPGASPGNGCPGQDVCIPRGMDKHGNICDGFCPPAKCKEDQLRCEVPGDPFTGCAQPALCIPKMMDFLGEFCPTQQCPLLCLETEFFCPGAFLDLGCKEEDICVPRGTSKSGDLCPGKCPVTCNTATEIKCKGQISFRTDYQKVLDV